MKKICALLTAALLLLTACSAEPGTQSASPAGSEPAPQTVSSADSSADVTTTEEQPTKTNLHNEIIIWTTVGEEERTKTLCEYFLGKPQQVVPAPEGGWTLSVKTVSPEDLISRMKETDDTSFLEGVLPDIEEMPDLFFFYSDDFEVLNKAGMLSPVPDDIAASVKSGTVPSAVKAASAGDELLAYPSSLDHTLLLYYDKSVISEFNDLADLIAKCGEAGRRFYVGSETTVFPASVFLSCGLNYEPVLLADGSVSQVNCDYYTEKGLHSAKLMQSLMSMEAFRAVEGSPSLAFSYTEDQAAAMITESYQNSELRSRLGDNFGVAALPPIADGEELIPELSRGTVTMIGVTPKQDETKRLFCHSLAEYLVSSEAQRVRYESDGTIPVNERVLKAAAETDETASALMAQMPNVVRNIKLSDGYYQAMARFTEKLLEGGSEMKTAKLQQLLDELSAFLMADVTKATE